MRLYHIIQVCVLTIYNNQNSYYTFSYTQYSITHILLFINYNCKCVFFLIESHMIIVCQQNPNILNNTQTNGKKYVYEDQIKVTSEYVLRFLIFKSKLHSGDRRRHKSFVFLFSNFCIEVITICKFLNVSLKSVVYIHLNNYMKIVLIQYIKMTICGMFSSSMSRIITFCKMMLK